MKVKLIIDEVFQDYKDASMLIAMCKCDWKCCIEQGLNKSVCQNSTIAKQKDIDISADEIFSRYIQNFITSAIVIGGLEPILQFDEILELIRYFREYNIDDYFIIYTGYYKDEITKYISNMKQYKNIIVKYGRYIPNQQPHYDEILGVYLASDNQYAEKIS
jgi:pyruvate-formate lyase-activating enzyme